MKNKFKLFLSAAFFVRIVFSFLVWHPDVNNHIDWGERFWIYGAKNFYENNVWNSTWPNQPPGTIYLYAGIKKVYDFIYSIFWWMNVNISVFPSNLIFFLEDNLYPALLKLPSIISDFGIAYLIYKCIKDKKLAKTGVFLWLVNPVVWYNSSIWGQTDSVIMFFVFLSFYLLSKKMPVLSVLAFAFSIFIKASLLIFVPVYMIFFLRNKFTFAVYVKAIFLSLATIIFLTLPFSKGNPVVWLFNLYQGKVFVQQLQVITANAFNIWATLTSIHEKPHTLMLGPLSYQTWGIIAFIISYVIIVSRYLTSKSKGYYWVLAMIAISSFALLTNMHERYLYPFFPYMTILALENNKLMKVYLIISVISILNLYNFWFFPQVRVLIMFMSFSDRLMPRILGLILTLCYVNLFKYFLRQTKPSRI